jgi:tRNA/tmRNA/rRNA uracil-C5-methylase (TrmA/RlmC/RlmD family)
LCFEFKISIQFKKKYLSQRMLRAPFKKILQPRGLMTPLWGNFYKFLGSNFLAKPNFILKRYFCENADPGTQIQPIEDQALASEADNDSPKETRRNNWPS